VSLLWIESKIKTYYHASPHEFKPGDRLVGGGEERNNFGTSHHRDKVFLSRDYEDAHHWAHQLGASEKTPVHVYEVEAPESSRHPQKDALGGWDRGYEYVAPYARVVRKDTTIDHDWDEC
jgi:hypothetical protein